MAFRTLSSLTVFTLLVCVCLQGIDAGWPSKMGKKDKDKMQAILDGRLDVPADLSLFVKYKNKKGLRAAKKFAKRHRFERHVKKFKLLSLRANNRTALEKLVANKNIEYVEPQHQIHALPLLGRDLNLNETNEARRLAETIDYGVNMVQADQLWDLPPPKERTTICVIDSGYGLGHPDLPNLEDNVTGTSTKSGRWSDDDYGHGTHCAGIIGAIGNNNEGVAGVMRDPNRFKFHIGKILNRKGDGSEDDMLDAVEGCVNAGAKVISMSFGTEDYSQSIENVCKDAYDKDILLVAAAGNDGEAAYTYPASFPEVISVAAVDRGGTLGGFSHFNDQVEIAGPGVEVLSTVTTKKGKRYGYTTWTGTSMATPFVAGVAAAVWSYFPECTNHQIRNVLIRTAKDEENSGCNEDLGFGIVQAKDAYDLLVKEGCMAGDVSPAPPSKGAIGGCSQDPSYVPPPTSAPTQFSCSEKVFQLELQTDEYSDETSWDLVDSNKSVVGSGGGYRKNRLYLEKLCVPPDEYIFTIRDSEGDGICCNYGRGQYSVTYNNQLVTQGGSFGYSKDVTFGTGENGAANVNDKRNCKDDLSWIFTTPKGKQRRCGFLAKNPLVLCALSGVDLNKNPASGYHSCPFTCDSCPKPLPPPTAAPSISPTKAPKAVAPTKTPTLSPTPLPTLTPTVTPTIRPTQDPTLPPTETPTIMPTSTPTPKPTASPTPQPTEERTTAGIAIWANSNNTPPEYRLWDGSRFSSSRNMGNTAMEWKIIQGAYSPTRDEAIVVGVTEDEKVTALMFNGVTWTELPFSPLTDEMTKTFLYGFDVRYESQSGNAVLVWHRGSVNSEILYRTWNGSSWSPESRIITPIQGRDYKELHLEASPISNEMVLVAHVKGDSDFCVVWDGTSWGNGLKFDNISFIRFRVINVVYEQKSGRAMVVYAGKAHYFPYQIWDGTSWSNERYLVLPWSDDRTRRVSGVAISADPSSNRIVLGLKGNSHNGIWLAVWDGKSRWGSVVKAASESPAVNYYGFAVAFVGNSGRALAVYGQQSNEVRYRTWSGGWSQEKVGPALGETPHTLMLSTSPVHNEIMLSAQDTGDDAYFCVWDGLSWGDTHKMTNKSTVDGNIWFQPFLFLWKPRT